MLQVFKGLGVSHLLGPPGYVIRASLPSEGLASGITARSAACTVEVIHSPPVRVWWLRRCRV